MKYYSAKWKPSHSPTISADYGMHNAGFIDVLRAEVASLRAKIAEIERECKYNRTKEIVGRLY